MIWDVIGASLGDMFEVNASFLFKKMDTNQDAKVGWDEFCTYMMIGLQEKDELDAERETPLMLCATTLGKRRVNQPDSHFSRIFRCPATRVM